MRQINVRGQEQRRRSHPLQRHRAGFVVPDFRPLLHQIFVLMRAETKSHSEGISRVPQLNAHDFLAGGGIAAGHASKKQRSGGVAVGMDSFQRRFPNVTVARLRIGFLVSLGASFPRSRLAERSLINTPVFSFLKIQGEVRRFDREIFFSRGRRQRRQCQSRYKEDSIPRHEASLLSARQPSQEKYLPPRQRSLTAHAKVGSPRRGDHSKAGSQSSRVICNQVVTLPAAIGRQKRLAISTLSQQVLLRSHI